MDLKDTIKFYREKKNISKSQLAKLIKTSPSYITELENGKKTNPSIKILARLKSTLEIPTVVFNSIDNLPNYYIDTSNKLAYDFPKIDEELANELHDLGFASDVIKTIECSKDESIIAFNRFLASANLPFDIPIEELEVLYDKAKDFLEFEFFKLGYIRVYDKK